MPLRASRREIRARRADLGDNRQTSSAVCDERTRRGAESARFRDRMHDGTSGSVYTSGALLPRAARRARGGQPRWCARARVRTRTSLRVCRARGRCMQPRSDGHARSMPPHARVPAVSATPRMRQCQARRLGASSSTPPTRSNSMRLVVVRIAPRAQREPAVRCTLIRASGVARGSL